jgi:hypothetical protein
MRRQIPFVSLATTTSVKPTTMFMIRWPFARTRYARWSKFTVSRSSLSQLTDAYRVFHRRAIATFWDYQAGRWHLDEAASIICCCRRTPRTG